MIQTNLLKTNQIYSYQELCELFNEQKKTGRSKQYQLKEWSRYFKFEKSINPKTNKVGNKYIITEIYDIPLEKEDGRGKSERSRKKTKYYDYFLPVLKYYMFYNDGFCEERVSKMFTDFGLKCYVNEEEEHSWSDDIDYEYLNDILYARRRYIFDSCLERAYNEKIIYFGKDLYIQDERADPEEEEIYKFCEQMELKHFKINDEHEKCIKQFQLFTDYKEKRLEYYIAVKKRFIKMINRTDLETSDIYNKYWIRWRDIDSLDNCDLNELKEGFIEGVQALNDIIKDSLMDSLYKHKIKENKSDEWFNNNVIKMEAYTELARNVANTIKYMN